MGLPQLRRYSPGTDFLGFGNRVPAAAPEVVMVTAGDGVSSRSVLYASGKEKTVVCIAHLCGDMTRHYAIPDLVENGYAFYAQQGRFAGNDAAALHEPVLADIAAGMQFLRSRGFEHIVLLGTGITASLYALYQAQATTPAPGRLTDTAAGDPFDLNKFEMPSADGFIFLSNSMGPGKALQQGIDPAVIDESDALSCDPELDMYNIDNGFNAPPQPSKYPADFLARYRAAQKLRTARI